MDLIKTVREELQKEAEAILLAAQRIDANIEKAIDLLYDCQGKVVVTGMGKTGIIGKKISATLASTGTTSIFLHAAEGIHGDLGILQKEDVVIAVSKSGNTQELVAILPFLKFNRIPIIAITGNKKGQLALCADVVIDSDVDKASEPFGLVPTASTTVALALGDALAVALLNKKNFLPEDFARFHPGGTIGKKLLLTVGELMHRESNPTVEKDADLATVIKQMSAKKLGCTAVIDEKGHLCGIITDGDLRRMLLCGDYRSDILAYEIMTQTPRFVGAATPAIDALNLMEDNKITMLPVLDEERKPVGMLHLHDLIQAGVVG